MYVFENIQDESERHSCARGTNSSHHSSALACCQSRSKNNVTSPLRGAASAVAVAAETEAEESEVGVAGSRNWTQQLGADGTGGCIGGVSISFIAGVATFADASR